MRRSPLLYDGSLRTARTQKAATFTELKSGARRVQVRRKGRYIGEIFLRREDARRWALGAMQEAAKAQLRSKGAILRKLERGALDLAQLDESEW